MPFLPPNQQRQSTEGISISHKPEIWSCLNFGAILITGTTTSTTITTTIYPFNSLFSKTSAFSAQTLLVGRQEGHPARKKSEWWVAGVVISPERGADLHIAQLMPLPLTVSCFSEIQMGSTFLVPAHLGSPGKRVVKWVCVCFQNNLGQPIREW